MYLDPGTGSILLQAIIASILGIGVFIKLFSKKIRSYFSKNGDSDIVQETKSDNEG